MPDFLKQSIWSLVSVIFRALSSILVNKIFAIQFGTSGITLLAHFQNLISIITQIPNDGINRGIIKYWSGNELTIHEKHRLLTAGFLFNIILFLVLVVITLLFQPYFFRDFDITIDSSIFFILFFSALLLYLFHLFLLSVILSFQRIKIYAIINMITSIILLIVVYLISQSNPLLYALLAFAFSHASGLVFSVYYVIKNKYVSVVKASLPTDGFSKLGEFVLMASSVLIFGKLTDFIIRDYAIQHFGLHLTGLWQSVVKISDSYMMLFINTVGIVYYPQISALIFDTDQLRVYLRDVIRIVIFVSITGLSLIYIFRRPVLTILFDSNFLPAEELMPFQLIGDFFCFLAYLLTYIISAQARTRTFIFLQAGSAIFYFGLVIFFSSMYGIEGIPVAHAARYGLLFLILIFLNKRILF
jgi:O-antigen/teichoic acid export membrane protein